MEPEFIIKAVLAIVGAGLIGGGIVMVVKANKTSTRAWGAVAIAAGIVMWLTILSTTIASSATG